MNIGWNSQLSSSDIRKISIFSFKRSLLATIISISFPVNVMARDFFDPQMLQAGLSDGQTVDLSQFEAGYQLPGDYVVDIYINDTFYVTRSMNFKAGKDGVLIPAITVSLLDDMGVDVSRVKGLDTLKGSDEVSSIESFLPQARVDFNLSQQQLRISVPQASMKPDAGELANESLWDNGIPAVILNYNITGSRSKNDMPYSGGEQENDSFFSSFDSGVNLGPWRFRSQSAYTVNRSQTPGAESQKTSDFSIWNMALKRDIAPLKGELTLGETSTDSAIFDGIPMRGVMLQTNGQMYPDSQRNFSPIISGIAKTHAQVTVKQNGNIIYQTYVSPGAFRFDNLTRTENNGDLLVTVKESDGSEHTQTVAYTSLPIMQRAGHLEYAFAAGQYYQRGVNDTERPLFASGTLIYGLPYDMTVYGGAIAAENYLSGAGGVGISMGDFGALAGDVTLARAQLKDKGGAPDETSTGASYRIKYSKNMLTTGTTMNLAAYRYSTEGFYSFGDVNTFGSHNEDNQLWYGRKRSTWQFMISQSMDEWGNIYVSGQRDDYWGRSDVTKTLSVGYNNTFKGVSYGISYNQDRTTSDDSQEQGTNHMIAANVTIPFRLFTPAQSLMNNSYVTLNSSLDNNHRSTSSLGFGGTALEDGALGYNVQESWGNQGQVASTALNASYSGSSAETQVGYNADRNTQSVNFGINGGVLLHQHGITLSRQIYDSAVLVRAPGSSGTKVMNSPNISTNAFGYAVVPSLMNYRQNTVMLDPSDMPDNAVVPEAGKRVYPTKGAIVLADYNVLLGHQVLMLLRYQGKPVPFGAMATLKNAPKGQDVSGIVDEGGRLYMAGMPEKGIVSVSWGNKKQCQVKFELPPVVPQKKGASVPMTTISDVCQ